MTKPRVFSGIQPSGDLTIGNYLGAIRNWVRDQDEYDSIFCVVDLHALSVPQDPETLRYKTWEVAAIYLAAGLDPARNVIVVQSHIPEHTSLCWLLNTVTPLGWLNRMTQFKSKSSRQKDSTSAGLLDYPVLMAADILAYHTNFVPVGEDQKQHLELTRDIAERFNGLFGDTLTVPEPLIPTIAARVMALDDPSKKMSKSEPAGAIRLLDRPETIRKKVARAVTDSLASVAFNPEQVGLYNILTMIQSLSGRTPDQIEQDLDGLGYRGVKECLAELAIAELGPLQQRFADFQSSPETVDAILAEGAASARPIARSVVDLVEERMGLRRPESTA